MPLLDIYKHVERLDIQSGKQNRFRCLHCKAEFSATSVTRIRGHFLCDPTSGVKACTAPPEGLKAELQKEESERASKKRRLASDSVEASSSRGSGQQSTLAQAFGKANKGEVDQAVARCFIANGIPFHLLRSKYFAEMLTAVGKIGSYKPPGPDTMRNRLLDAEKARIGQELSDLHEFRKASLP